MPLHQSRPDPTGHGVIPHFIHVKTGHGESWKAWIAGPAMWFDCHSSGRSKPCLHAISGGKLTCKTCSPLKPTQSIGYQPLYRELDSRPCFVVLHADQREHVEQLPLHRLVVVGRGGDQADGVYIRATLANSPKFETRVAWKQKPIDLTETLLRVWSLPELTAWYRGRETAADPALGGSEVPLMSNGEPFGPMHEAAARRAEAQSASDADDTFGQLGKRILERVSKLEATKNGKHKPKG